MQRRCWTVAGKYSVETGDGYLGTFSVRSSSAEINVSDIDIEPGDEFVVTNAGSKAVHLKPFTPQYMYNVLHRGNVMDTEYAPLSSAVLDHLDAGDGDDLRIYAGNGNVLRIVNADDDPFVSTDGAGERWDADLRRSTLRLEAEEAWETQAQITKAAEEFSELTAALNRMLNDQQDHNELLDELVDARLMLWQLELLFDEERLEQALADGLNDLEHRLEVFGHDG